MKVIAHRGSSQAAPENTIPAIKKAIRSRADAVEIDVQMTRDGQVVVFHDEWLNRTTDGDGFLYEMSYAKLRQLDAGSWFHSAFKQTKIPLLTEVLELVQQHPLPLHVELKNNLVDYPGLEEKVIRHIHDYGLTEQVTLSSFRVDSLLKCLYISPRIRRGYLCWNSLQPVQQLEALQAARVHSIHPHLSMVTDLIQPFQDQGYAIFPYVVERKLDVKRCLNQGVDGCFTNTPRKTKYWIRSLLKH